MSRARRLGILAAAPFLLVGMLYIGAQQYFEAAAFVIRAADMDGVARRAASLEAEPVSERDVAIPWRGGRLRGREYRTDRPTGRAILLAPGVHAGGVDEPRLISFAREIAATGHPVVSVELPDLREYRITSRSTDMIADAARWLGREWHDRMPAGEREAALMGISFGGGLAVVAASHLAGDIAWTLSFGGHGDLPRTLRYLCTGQEPDGTHRPPHDYGVVVILLGVAERVVPPEQVAPLREAVLTFLRASQTDMTDKARAAEEFEDARALAHNLPEPARTFMGWVNDRDVARLGSALLPHVGAMADDPALSPERNAPPTGPEYLLHGADDNVIPAAESELLAAHLRRTGGQAVQLSSRLITHAEVDQRPGLIEIWRLVRFWAGPL